LKRGGIYWEEAECEHVEEVKVNRMRATSKRMESGRNARSPGTKGEQWE